MTAPLYQLVNHQREFQLLAEEIDLAPEVVRDTLEALEGDIQAKAYSVAAFSRNLDASAEAIRAAARRMLDRADRIEKRAEGVRQYLLFNMQAAGITRIEHPEFVLAVKKNPPAVVIDEDAELPPQYLKTPEPPPPRPDKAAIAKALKAGAVVPGAYLTYSDRLEIKE